MSQASILAPVLAMVLLTFIVWVYMFVRRIGFIQGNEITPEQLAVPGALAELSPPEVSNPSDNFQNLLEMPVLFYVLALILFATNRVDGIHLAAAWVFVAFRYLHSAVHCSVNIVMLRFYLYLISSLAVWWIALRLTFQLFRT